MELIFFWQKSTNKKTYTRNGSYSSNPAAGKKCHIDQKYESAINKKSKFSKRSFVGH